jgi:LuxR family maltose regulon positive regulatory protein
MNNRLRGQVYQALGECYLVTGEFEKCIPLLWEAMNLSIQIPNVFLFTRSAFRLGRALIIQGKLVEAKRVYQDSLRLLRESGLTDGSLLWRSEIGLGDVVRERGDLVTAERLLREGLKHAQLQGQPFDLVFAYLYLSQLEHEKGNSQCALELLEQADRLFQTYAIPMNVRSQWEYYCVPIWIAVADWQEIERWRQARHLESDVPVIYSNEQLLMALSRVHIAQDKLTDALNLLAQLAQEAEVAGRNGRLIEICNLSALACYQKGNSDESLNFLRKSLRLAEPEGYRQIFLGEGEPMIKLLKQLRASRLAPRLQDYVNRLLASQITSEVIV